MHLVSYNSFAYNRIQQRRMVKGKVASPKGLLLVITQIKEDWHTLIEYSVQFLLQIAFTNYIQLYN